jgi:NodT family efflux transporter outer membrane factor (OMF) lipoprotein
MFKFTGVSLAASVLLLAGCEVGPDYKPPKINVTQNFPDGAATQPSTINPAAPVVIRWWRTFNDPELNSLINRAIASNLDLRNAQSRIIQARAQRGVIGSQLWPEINADGGYQHARGSKNVTFPIGALSGSSGSSSGAAATPANDPTVSPLAVASGLGGSSSGGAGAGGSSASVGSNAPLGGPVSPLGNGGFPGVTTDLYQAGFDASWEIDLFGGQRRAIEAADADTAAALEDRRDIQVTLLAEVARNYIQLRAAQRQEQIAEQNLHDQQDTLALTRSRFSAGFATQLDVARQAAELATTAATIPALEATVRQSIHALSVLLALDPEALTAELSTAESIPPVPANVPIGMPMDLVRRRPDIRRAERQLAAASARIGVAEADLYPRFSLTGSFGFDSSQIKHFLDWSSRYFVLSPGVSWPIFDAGRIHNNIRVQREITQQAATSYQSTVLTALREVDDALVSYRTEQVRRAALADAVDASRQAEELARQQYEKGVVDFLTVLDVQRSLLQAEDALAQSDSAISMDLVALYKALGGGWEVTTQ